MSAALRGGRRSRSAGVRGPRSARAVWGCPPSGALALVSGRPRWPPGRPQAPVSLGRRCRNGGATALKRGRSVPGTCLSTSPRLISFPLCVSLGYETAGEPGVGGRSAEPSGDAASRSGDGAAAAEARKLREARASPAGAGRRGRVAAFKRAAAGLAAGRGGRGRPGRWRCARPPPRDAAGRHVLAGPEARGLRSGCAQVVPSEAALWSAQGLRPVCTPVSWHDSSHWIRVQPVGLV